MQFTKSCIAALLLLGCSVAFGQSKKFNKPLADSLAAMVKVDQIAAYIPTGEYKKLSEQQWQHFKDSVFNTHQRILADVFKKYGYPGYDLVGKEGSNHFWLMVQHCDKQPAFQKEVLAAMKPELAKENADGKNFAYLTDRVNLNTGSKQVYGTQLTYNTNLCQAIPRPMADSSTVNARRQEVGLQPIEQYLNDMSEMHFKMNEAVYRAKGITAPKLIAVPKGV